ncbi:MAG: PIG-L deacetylase family protein [Candidatus Promineifilaceae bacterium]
MSKTLLTILAHPDDESFGMGGTLAKYSAEGVDVHICIATDGAVGTVAEGHDATRDNLVAVRAAELDQAIAILGGTLHKLNFRDSGYINDPANKHPEAFINVDTDAAVGSLVKLMRELKPDVVVTHDETGGYFHPDHIRCWEITTKAFAVVNDAEAYPDAGDPFQPARLYFAAFSNNWVKVYTRVIRLRGGDPTAQGRNKDIDMTRLGVDKSMLHATIDYRKYWDAQVAASSMHASQGGGSGGPFRVIPKFVRKRFFAKNSFIREYPPVPEGFHEYDLFPA